MTRRAERFPIRWLACALCCLSMLSSTHAVAAKPVPDPPRELVDAMARGEVDAAIAWGPLAGYFAGRAPVSLVVTTIEAAPDRAGEDPLLFSMAAGVRHDDEALTRTLPAARIYVTNERSGELTVIDGASHDVVATVRLGKRPRGMQVSPDGRRLYVALSGSPIAGPEGDERTLPPADKSADGIGVVDLDTLRLVRTLRGVSDPEQLTVSRDGRRLYVASEDTATTVVLNESDGRILTVLTVGHEPEGIATSPDGRWVYVTSEAEDEVAVIDTADDSIAAQVPVGARPRSVVFSAHGPEAFVSCEKDVSVSVLDTRRHVQVARIPIPGVGARPMGMALSPDGATLYVTTGRGGTLVAIDTRTHELRGSVAVGPRPWGVTISADGRWLYTANGPSNDVSVVDARALAVVEKVPVRTSPWGTLARGPRDASPAVVEADQRR